MKKFQVVNEKGQVVAVYNSLGNALYAIRKAKIAGLTVREK